MKRLFSFLISSMALGAMPTSCTTDNYEKGEGAYSLMRADFAELNTDSEKKGTRFTIDDGDSYALTTSVQAKWLTTADSTYRVAVYYNKVSEGIAECLSLRPVGTLTPIAHWRYETQPQDPLGIESMWLSCKGKYLNMGLLLKSGYVGDEEGMHSLALACDTTMLNADRTRTAHYRLLHSQGNTPSYYTNRAYASILLPDTPAVDTVRLLVNTYDGPQERVFPLR